MVAKAGVCETTLHSAWQAGFAAGAVQAASYHHSQLPPLPRRYRLTGHFCISWKRNQLRNCIWPCIMWSKGRPNLTAIHFLCNDIPPGKHPRGNILRGGPKNLDSLADPPGCGTIKEMLVMPPILRRQMPRLVRVPHGEGAHH